MPSQKSRMFANREKNRSIAKSRRLAGDSCVDCASALRVEKEGGKREKKNIYPRDSSG